MVATRTAHLADISLPDIGMPDAEPLLPPGLYADRLERLRAVMEARSYDHLVVWADREHSANLAYLSGFDPRFEEALLIVGPTDDPAVLVGNECAGMAAAAPLTMRPVMFQDMSLPGQPRDIPHATTIASRLPGETAAFRIASAPTKTSAGGREARPPATKSAKQSGVAAPHASSAKLASRQTGSMPRSAASRREVAGIDRIAARKRPIRRSPPAYMPEEAATSAGLARRYRSATRSVVTTSAAT